MNMKKFSLIICHWDKNSDAQNETHYQKKEEKLFHTHVKKTVHMLTTMTLKIKQKR